MKTFKEFLNEANVKAGDGVRTPDGSDGIVHHILPGGNMAVVITGWDYFGGDLESKKPNYTIEDVSDLKKKNVGSKYKDYFNKSKNMKL